MQGGQNFASRMAEMRAVLAGFWSFEGKIGRFEFAVQALGCLALGALCAGAGWLIQNWPLHPGPVSTSWPLWLPRIQLGAWTSDYSVVSTLLALGVMSLLLAVNYRLAVLSFRRAHSIGAHPYVAALAVVPALQLVSTAFLAIRPTSKRETGPYAGADDLTARGAVRGLAAGLGITVAVVGISAGLFGVYGYSLFVLSPFVIGLATGYLINKDAEQGAGATIGIAFSALFLGGLALVAVAFEGLICLLMASPLIAVMGLAGALVGRAFAQRGRAGTRATQFSIAMLPLLMLGESAVPPTAHFASAESIEVSAPPAAVWDSVVHMGPIPGAPAAPFRWGLAYPMRGVIRGEGVGAVREGVFSTGVASEQVTEWRPGRRLAFKVLSDPPSLHELSPYPEVHARHTKGYFRTADAIFDITPLPNGRTRLTLTTHHELDLAPQPYWTPMARWAVHANKVRVLRHFRDQAEAEVLAGARSVG